ncbi:MAG TPA: nicotinamidase [Vicinamibacterales bacterium]
MMTGSRSALLMVDVQKDFCPGGALAVPDGDRVVPPLNRYAADAAARGWPVYASRDWHPRVTQHFRPYGGEWPPHCVQDTEGATFHDDLQLPAGAVVISKGQASDSPGYSALEGRSPNGTTFLDDLRARGIGHLYVGGLATDYCVKHSVLDALRAGLEVTVLEDAIAGVDVKAGDSERALEEMRAAGAHISSHKSQDPSHKSQEEPSR